MRKNNFKWAMVAVLTMCMAGSALAADHLWTNNGGDRDWDTVNNWDQYTGSCGALIATNSGPTVAGTGWAIISTDGLPDCGFRPTVPAGMGPIVYNPASSTGAYGFVVNNNMEMAPGSYFRTTRGPVTVATGPSEVGSITINGGAMYVSWATSGGSRGGYIGREGTGTLTINGGGSFGARSCHIEVGYEANSNGTVIVNDGTLFLGDRGSHVLVIGAAGTGTLTMNGGRINITDNDGGNYPYLMVGQDHERGGGSTATGTVNLNGGLLYSKGYPNVNPNGTALGAVINFNVGGKLATRHWDDAETTIRTSITDGDFNNGVSANPDDASWHFYQRPAEYSDYSHNNVPADIWVIAKTPSCDIGVAPTLAQDLVMAPDITQDVVYTVHNFGTVSASYTVAEVIDEPWLTLDKVGGGPIDPGTEDTMTATVNTTGMSAGIYTVDLVFTDDCTSPGNTFTRTINLEIAECFWDVTPNVIHMWADCATPDTYTYTVSNDAASLYNLTYTVEECDAAGASYDWPHITLPVPASGGPIAPGASGTIDITVAASQSDVQAYVKFVPTCGSGMVDLIREIRQWYQADATGQYNYVPLAGYKHAYLGDVDPLLVDSCKHVPPDGEVSGECLFVATCCQGGFTGLIHGSVVDDPDAANGKAFYIDRTETGRAGYSSHVSTAIPDVNKDTFLGGLGFTMVARVKVLYNLNVGACLYAFNDGTGDAQWMQCQIRTGWGGAGPSLPGKIREYYNHDSGGNDITSVQLATTVEEREAYHIIRINVGGGPYGDLVSYRCWYDEQAAPVLSVGGNWGGGYAYMPDRFGFGKYGASAAGDIFFDWISFTNMGMYGPGEEDDCIGTLIPDFPPPCNIPFADADGDGDVDQDDFAEFQICYSGGDPGATYPDIPEYCRCFNREGADNDVDDNDFAEFQKCASGPNIPVAGDPDCDFSP
ncbi:MAG: hypothetical protein ACYTA5_24795 [Planctomycetota bacterium]